jgi:hypothetical protein
MIREAQNFCHFYSPRSEVEDYRRISVAFQTLNSRDHSRIRHRAAKCTANYLAGRA